MYNYRNMVKILYTHVEKHATFTTRVFEESLMTGK